MIAQSVPSGWDPNLFESEAQRSRPALGLARRRTQGLGGLGLRSELASLLRRRNFGAVGSVLGPVSAHLRRCRTEAGQPPRVGATGVNRGTNQ